MTNKDLQDLYHSFNRKWFGNRLPKDMVVGYSKFDYAIGYTKFYRNRPLYIEISSKVRWSCSLTAMVLLHEMCHVSLPAKFEHGSKFHQEMLKLAKKGAFRSWW